MGIAIKQGLYLENKKQVAFAYDDLYTNGQRVLMNPFLEVGIIESSFESIVNSGMSYGLNRCDITVLMDVSPHQFDHSLLINSTKAIKKCFVRHSIWYLNMVWQLSTQRIMNYLNGLNWLMGN